MPTTRLFLDNTQAVDDAAFEAGACLSLPCSIQMKTECIYSPVCHPAANGRGITLATTNKQGLIQKQALTCLVTHRHTCRVDHTIADEVFLLCAPVFLSDLSTSLQHVYRTQESVTQLNDCENECSTIRFISYWLSVVCCCCCLCL